MEFEYFMSHWFTLINDYLVCKITACNSFLMIYFFRNSTVKLLAGSKMTLFKFVLVVMLMAVFAQDVMDKSKNSTNKGKNSFMLF